MKMADAEMTCRRLRAPKEPNTALIEPSAVSVGDILANNRNTLAAAAQVDVGGLCLSELSASARNELFRAAHRFTSRYQDSAARYSSSQAFILSGHQPQLFHPGVWFKNVALAKWSQAQRGLGIHLIIDSDLCRTASIRVPAGEPTAPRVVDVGFDAPLSPIPYEERRIHDTTIFDSFDQRVCATIGSLVPNPLVARMWPYARDAARSGAGLAQAITRARHRLQQSWGLDTLEVPWSHVCDSDNFRRFFLAILSRLREFQTVHNEALRTYRKMNRIRDHARPVAELQSNAEWLETPFWCWSVDQPQRCPLMARVTRTGIELRAQAAGTFRAVLLDRDIEKAIDQLAAARREGFKIRSRALLTTMYTRMVLSDLFLHGIGGAKYDELTDEITRQFWQTSPLEYLVLSATVLLPISRLAIGADDVRRLDGMLRDLWYHPENHVDLVDTMPKDRQRRLQLISEKNRWIKCVPAANAPGVAKRRHDGIVAATAALRQHVAPLRASLLDERQQLSRELRCATVLSSREYSFCLFPENKLRRTLLDLLH